MSTGGLSRMRLARMHDVMVGYVERGELPGLVTLVCPASSRWSAGGARCMSMRLARGR